MVKPLRRSSRVKKERETSTCLMQHSIDRQRDSSEGQNQNTVQTNPPPRSLTRPPVVRRVTSGTLGDDDQIRLDSNKQQQERQEQRSKSYRNSESNPSLDASSISSVESYTESGPPPAARSKKDPDAIKIQVRQHDLSGLLISVRSLSARAGCKHRLNIVCLCVFRRKFLPRFQRRIKRLPHGLPGTITSTRNRVDTPTLEPMYAAAMPWLGP